MDEHNNQSQSNAVPTLLLTIFFLAVIGGYIGLKSYALRKILANLSSDIQSCVAGNDFDTAQTLVTGWLKDDVVTNRVVSILQELRGTEPNTGKKVIYSELMTYSKGGMPATFDVNEATEDVDYDIFLQALELKAAIVFQLDENRYEEAYLSVKQASHLDRIYIEKVMLIESIENIRDSMGSKSITDAAYNDLINMLKPLSMKRPRND